MNNISSLYTTKPMLSAFWLLSHFALGLVVAQSSVVSQIWCASLLALAVYRIAITKNRNDEAVFWAAYFAGADVALRACGGALLWEIGKFGVLLCLLLGLVVESKHEHKFPGIVIIMFLLLIPGMMITFTWSNRVREDITFNISGMVCLLISMAYFHKRNISYETFKKMIAFSLLPVIVLCSVLFIRTPDISEISFNTQANAAMSGGFGPNQVATILGYGWLVLLLMVVMRERVTFNKVLTLLLLAFVLYRALFTFSRGGNLAAILSLVAFLGVYSSSKQQRVSMTKTIRTLVLFFALGAFVFSIIDTATNGVFGYRMTGKDMSGQRVEDVTTGRSSILEEEFVLFCQNPMGVGVGGSTHFRELQFHEFYASHNEFGRLLSEHGILGIGVILLILLMPLSFNKKIADGENKAYCMAFFVLSIASMMHSGCRTAMPEFLYGLSFIYLLPQTHNN